MALTDEQVQELRVLHATGEWSHRQLAERFSVAPSTATDLVNGKTRPDAGGPLPLNPTYLSDLPNDPPTDKCEIYGPVVFVTVGKYPDDSPASRVELADPEAGGPCARSSKSAEHHLVFRGAGGADDPTNTARVCQWHHDHIHLEVDQDSDEPRWFWNPEYRVLTDPKLKQYVLTRDIYQELEQSFVTCDQGLTAAIRGLNTSAVGIVYWLYRFLKSGAYYAGGGYDSIYELAAGHGMTNQSTVKGYLSTAHAYFGHLGLDPEWLTDRGFSYRDLKNAAAVVKKLPKEAAMKVLEGSLDLDGQAMPGVLPDTAREQLALPEKAGKVKVHVSGNFNVSVDCELTVDEGANAADVLLSRFRGHQWVTGTDELDAANLVVTPSR